jgi:hypothetical protein
VQRNGKSSLKFEIIELNYGIAMKSEKLIETQKTELNNGMKNQLKRRFHSILEN